MASGDILAELEGPYFPATLSAVPVILLGTNTPAEQVPLNSFDNITQWYLDFTGRIHNWDESASLKLNGCWFPNDDPTSGEEVVWGAAIRRLNAVATQEDFDSTHTYSYQKVTSTPTTTNGKNMPNYFTITFTSAQVDGLKTDEFFLLRFSRFVGDAADDYAELAKLLAPRSLIEN